MASLWCIQIASMTLALWGYYGVKQGLPEHKHCSVTTVNLVSKRAPQGTSTTCPGLRSDSPPARTEQDSMLITLAARTACTFTLTTVSFWNFPFNTYRLWLTTGQWNHRSEAVDKGGLLVCLFWTSEVQSIPFEVLSGSAMVLPEHPHRRAAASQLQTWPSMLTFNTTASLPPYLTTRQSSHRAKQPGSTGKSSLPQWAPTKESLTKVLFCPSTYFSSQERKSYEMKALVCLKGDNMSVCQKNHENNFEWHVFHTK